MVEATDPSTSQSKKKYSPALQMLNYSQYPALQVTLQLARSVEEARNRFNMDMAVMASNAQKAIVYNNLRNTASLYNFASNVNTSSKLTLADNSSKEVQRIKDESSKAVEVLKKEVTFKDSNSAIFDYYNTVSDSIVASEVVRELCKTIGNDVTEKPPQWSIIKGLFVHIKEKLHNAIERSKIFIGVVGAKLKSSLNSLGRAVGKDIVKFIEKLKNLAGRIYTFTLTIIEKLFSFISDIRDIAQEKKWNIDQITLEIPSVGFSVLTVQGIPIPIPEIRTPTVSIAFKPC
jgi:hypothetical protein